MESDMIGEKFSQPRPIVNTHKAPPSMTHDDEHIHNLIIGLMESARSTRNHSPHTSTADESTWNKS